MGASPGRICPPRPPRAPEGQHHGARHAHHVHRARPPPTALRVPAVRVPRLSRWANRRYLMTLSWGFLTASRRRCSVLSGALARVLGSVVSISRPGHLREAVLSALRTQTARSSVSPVANQGRNPDGTGAARSAFRPLGVQGGHPVFVPRPGALQSSLHAQISADTGRKPDGTGRAPSAFRALAVSGFIPRPGLLRRIPHTETSQDRGHRKSQTSVLISCPTRKAITSSYSSTRGFPPVQRKRPAAPSRAGPVQKSSKTVSREGPSSSSAPELSQECRREKEADGTKGQRPTRTDGSATCDGSRPGKRKTCLLPRRRGGPVTLPTPPELGFVVTAEHLDAEKQAALRSIYRALRGGETEAIPDLSAIRAVWRGPAPADLAAPSRIP